MTKSLAIRSQPFNIAREALIAAALRVALRDRNDHVPDAGQPITVLADHNSGSNTGLPGVGSHDLEETTCLRPSE
ncbi:MAG: hypothetical protein RIC14_06530 [Filomicrobium sp.]